MRHHEIIPTDDHQVGHINRRVAAQINLKQGHWLKPSQSDSETVLGIGGPWRGS
jgi:hypothetical protein